MNAGRQRWFTGAGAAVLAAYTLYRFREAVFTFFVMDDFWVMHDAHRVQIHSLWDVQQLLWFSHQKFRLYRPLTTTAYSYVLQSLFGFDSSGHHAFQLLVFAANVLLVRGIVQRLTGSSIAGFVAALLYLLSPGQALNAYWLSAFTMMGTTIWVFFMLWCWLALQGRMRVAICTLLQLGGLLASEHAIVAPVLCVIVAWLRREPWRRTAITVGPAAIAVGLYCATKLLYLRTAPVYSAAYTVNFLPDAVIEDLGRYVLACFNVLAVQNFTPSTDTAIGGGLIVALLLAAWSAMRGSAAARMLAAGISMFVVSLTPVLALRGHHYDHYICTAALGAAVAVIGIGQLLTTHWRWLVAAMAVGLLAFDLQTGEMAWRSTRNLQLVVNGSLTSAAWVDGALQAQRDHPNATEFLVPIQTNYVFAIGKSQAYFPGMPARITGYRPQGGFKPTPLQAVVQPMGGVRLGGPLPFWSPRWDWIRQLAR